MVAETLIRDKAVDIRKIKPNPNNPRLIRDEKFKKLVKSMQDFPEMCKVRPVVVNKDMVILGGNMRYKAALEAGWKEIPVEVVDWPEEKQREFIIKDNVGFGEHDWDVLANEWDIDDLNRWGIDEKDTVGSKWEKCFSESDTAHNDAPVYPITILASREEYEKYENMKKKYKVKTDLELFSVILEGL